MTGSFPSQLGNMSSLQHLLLKNFLGVTGSIPSEIKKLSNLESFHLSGGGLFDPSPIPINGSSMPHLESIHISSAMISGEIPLDFEKIGKLSSRIGAECHAWDAANQTWSVK
jgi:hypothetical protein